MSCLCTSFFPLRPPASSASAGIPNNLIPASSSSSSSSPATAFCRLDLVDNDNPIASRTANSRTTLSLHLRLRGRRNPSGSCRASSSGPPPPPLPDPPSPKDPADGTLAVFSGVQDRIQIFFAVLLWMSLFFWGSAWDGRDNARKNKGPWFRK